MKLRIVAGIMLMAAGILLVGLTGCGHQAQSVPACTVTHTADTLRVICPQDHYRWEGVTS